MTADPTPHANQPEPLYVVRLWDGMDGAWCDVTGPISKSEADGIWREHTQDGTRNTSFADIDYYEVFPADTEMKWSGGKEMFR